MCGNPISGRAEWKYQLLGHLLWLRSLPPTKQASPNKGCRASLRRGAAEFRK